MGDWNLEIQKMLEITTSHIPVESIDPSRIKYILTSHSIDNVFDYCPRKFEFLQYYDKRPARESGYAAMVGTALHEGMQQYLISKADGHDELIARQNGFVKMGAFFPWHDEHDQHAKTRSFGQCALMLQNMMEHPAWKDWELVKVDGHGWAVEVPFLIKHVSQGLFKIKTTGEWAMLCTQGKIDMIMRNVYTNKIRTFDIKTTSLAPELVRAEYSYSGQQIGYTEVMKSMMDVKPDDFEINYMVCRFYANDPPQIEHVPMPKHQDLIDDYWITKVDRLQRMIEFSERGWFPRTNGGCHSWGRECTFFDVCLSRDYGLINHWFDTAIETEAQTGYDYWVTLEV